MNADAETGLIDFTILDLCSRPVSMDDRDRADAQGAVRYAEARYGTAGHDDTVCRPAQAVGSKQGHQHVDGSCMARTRIHNLFISLDGFGTGEGQSADAPMGHAGRRLAEWMFATRFGAAMLGRPGGAPAPMTRSPSSGGRYRRRDHGCE